MNKIELHLPPLEENEDKSCHFKNRIRKNYKHIRKWAKRSETNCFRIYDRDIKEYPVSIDFYGGQFCIHYYFSHYQELGPPPELENKVIDTLTSLFSTSPDCLFWKNRIKRKKIEQYEKIDASDAYFIVYEYGLKFWVNLSDYLDTGLFLDHRETRQLIAKASQGKDLLNLFAYTSTFSVHATAAGATSTTNVDLSNTYIHWSQENFKLNNINLSNHSYVRADCLKFLEEESLTYDLIIIDPPTISRSKKMEYFFDIQVEYFKLITKAQRLLRPNGLIFFSTNSRHFFFDQTLFPTGSVRDITKQTLPLDFHNQKIHKSWIISDIPFPHSYVAKSPAK